MPGGHAASAPAPPAGPRTPGPSPPPRGNRPKAGSPEIPAVPRRRTAPGSAAAPAAPPPGATAPRTPPVPTAATATGAHHQHPAQPIPGCLPPAARRPVPADQLPLIQEHVKTGPVQIARQHPDPFGILVPIGHENVPARPQSCLNPNFRRPSIQQFGTPWCCYPEV